MAVNNRAEAIIVADATLVPTLTLAQHKTMLNDNILNSVTFDKDVIASETPIVGAVTIDYANKDLATVTTAVDLAVSFTNLENGAVKYLEITKAAANVISFVGASDRVNYRDYINTVETVVVYQVSNKNGNIYVEALFAPNSTAWQSLTLNTSYFTGYAKYRVNNFSGKIELEIDVTCISKASVQNIASMNASEWPNRNVRFELVNQLYIAGSIYAVPCQIFSSNGGIRPYTTALETGQKYYAYFEYYKTIL